jgi:hypothetical protein
MILKLYHFKLRANSLIVERVFEHNTGYCVTVYLTRRKEGKWSHKEAISLSDGLSIYLYRKDGKEAKGWKGMRGMCFTLFKVKGRKGFTPS